MSHACMFDLKTVAHSHARSLEQVEKLYDARMLNLKTVARSISQAGPETVELLDYRAGVKLSSDQPCTAKRSHYRTLEHLL